MTRGEFREPAVACKNEFWFRDLSLRVIRAQGSSAGDTRVGAVVSGEQRNFAAS
jgi:hypothetical protein